MRQESWDVVLLDWWLPTVDGVTLLREFRQKDASTPVLLLTAHDAVSDRVCGLNGGADDYLCKPFAFEELLARVRALVRRPDRRGSTVLSFDDISVDLSTQRTTRGGKRVDLTVKEQALLVFFLRHAGEVLSRGANLRAGLGRAIRRAFEHVRSSCEGNPPKIRGLRAATYLHFTRPWIRFGTNRRPLKTNYAVASTHRGPCQCFAKLVNRN